MSNYETLVEEISLAAKKSGRNSSDITLVAVIKEVDWYTALPLYHKGQRNFAVNRLADAIAKQMSAPKDCLWHFIGNLQSNKVHKAVGRFTLIHSVDSLSLAKKISEASQEKGMITSILLQANTSGESTKHGLKPKEWKECFEEVLRLEGISIEGLMTMAPLSDDEKVIRRCFGKLRDLRDELNTLGGVDLKQLSMGMSQDFKLAIEEGATIIRIGSALFSRR